MKSKAPTRKETIFRSDRVHYYLYDDIVRYRNDLGHAALCYIVPTRPRRIDLQSFTVSVYVDMYTT